MVWDPPSQEIAHKMALEALGKHKHKHWREALPAQTMKDFLRLSPELEI